MIKFVLELSIKSSNSEALLPLLEIEVLPPERGSTIEVGGKGAPETDPLVLFQSQSIPELHVYIIYIFLALSYANNNYDRLLKMY